MSSDKTVTIKFKLRAERNAADHRLAAKYTKGRQFDVDLVTSDRKVVAAHRIVLVMFSKNLDKMLSNLNGDGIIVVPMREFKLPDYSFSVIKKIVDLLYLREVCVTAEQKDKMMDAVRLLRIHGVIDSDSENLKATMKAGPIPEFRGRQTTQNVPPQTPPTVSYTPGKRQRSQTVYMERPNCSATPNQLLVNAANLKLGSKMSISTVPGQANKTLNGNENVPNGQPKAPSQSMARNSIGAFVQHSAVPSSVGQIQKESPEKTASMLPPTSTNVPKKQKSHESNPVPVTHQPVQPIASTSAGLFENVTEKTVSSAQQSNHCDEQRRHLKLNMENAIDSMRTDQNSDGIREEQMETIVNDGDEEANGAELIDNNGSNTSDGNTDDSSEFSDLEDLKETMNGGSCSIHRGEQAIQHVVQPQNAPTTSFNPVQRQRSQSLFMERPIDIPNQNHSLANATSALNVPKFGSSLRISKVPSSMNGKLNGNGIANGNGSHATSVQILSNQLIRKSNGVVAQKPMVSSSAVGQIKREQQSPQKVVRNLLPSLTSPVKSTITSKSPVKSPIEVKREKDDSNGQKSLGFVENVAENIVLSMDTTEHSGEKRSHLGAIEEDMMEAIQEDDTYDPYDFEEDTFMDENAAVNFKSTNFGGNDVPNKNGMENGKEIANGSDNLQMNQSEEDVKNDDLGVNESNDIGDDAFADESYNNEGIKEEQNEVPESKFLNRH